MGWGPARAWGPRGLCSKWQTEQPPGSSASRRGAGERARGQGQLCSGWSPISERRSGSLCREPPTWLALCCPGADGRAVTHRKAAGRALGAPRPPGVPEPDQHVSQDCHCPPALASSEPGAQCRGRTASPRQHRRAVPPVTAGSLPARIRFASGRDGFLFSSSSGTSCHPTHPQAARPTGLGVGAGQQRLPDALWDYLASRLLVCSKWQTEPVAEAHLYSRSALTPPRVRAAERPPLQVWLAQEIPDCCGLWAEAHEEDQCPLSKVPPLCLLTHVRHQL